jgi:hypothetical protein
LSTGTPGREPSILHARDTTKEFEYLEKRFTIPELDYEIGYQQLREKSSPKNEEIVRSTNEPLRNIQQAEGWEKAAKRSRLQAKQSMEKILGFNGFKDSEEEPETS